MNKHKDDHARSGEEDKERRDVYRRTGHAVPNGKAVERLAKLAKGEATDRPK